MKELDSNMLISDQISAELLIESAGLTKQEQLMIRTAAKNHIRLMTTQPSCLSTMGEFI